MYYELIFWTFISENFTAAITFPCFKSWNKENDSENSLKDNIFVTSSGLVYPDRQPHKQTDRRKERQKWQKGQTEKGGQTGRLEANTICRQQKPM